MKIREALELVNPAMPPLSARRRRLAGSFTVEDFRKVARRRLPRSVFDYVDGGADEEFSRHGNGDAIRKWRMLPRTLVDVSQASTATTILGREAAAPFGFAPTGYTRMISPALGEPAVAAEAARAEVPYVLSTMATTSLEDVARVPEARNADRWFQLYVWQDRDLAFGLVDRAAEAGYRVLEIAIDTAVSGFRVRDSRNGFTIPPQMTPSTIMDIGLKPAYWVNMLRSPTLEFANVTGGKAGAGDAGDSSGTAGSESSSGVPEGGYTIANITKQFDPSLTWDVLADIRKRWDGKLVLKGTISPADALRARDLGLDAVHLSNHGGRQLDRAVAPIDLVRPVRQAVGDDFGVIVDSGFTHGQDIAVAIALGADAAFVGKAYLWGLVAAGRQGVEAVAGQLQTGLLRTMQLLGVTSVAELREHGPELLVRD